LSDTVLNVSSSVLAFAVAMTGVPRFRDRDTFGLADTGRAIRAVGGGEDGVTHVSLLPWK
jgi:hypothetical protein